jgi:hypothetical protein
MQEPPASQQANLQSANASFEPSTMETSTHHQSTSQNSTARFGSVEGQELIWHNQTQAQPQYRTSGTLPAAVFFTNGNASRCLEFIRNGLLEKAMTESVYWQTERCTGSATTSAVRIWPHVNAQGDFMVTMDVSERWGMYISAWTRMNVGDVNSLMST